MGWITVPDTTSLSDMHRVRSFFPVKPRSTSNHCSAVWETAAFMGLLQVCLEFIATTYRSTIFKTQVCCVYPPLCIHVSMSQYSHPSTHGTSGLAVGSAWEQSDMHLKLLIKWTQGCTWRPVSCEHSDALGGCNRVSKEIHFQPQIVLTERCTWRPWSSKFGNTLRCCDNVNSEAMIQQGCDAVEGHDWIWLMVYLEAVDGWHTGYCNSIH